MELERRHTELTWAVDPPYILARFLRDMMEHELHRLQFRVSGYDAKHNVAIEVSLVMFVDIDPG